MHLNLPLSQLGGRLSLHKVFTKGAVVLPRPHGQASKLDILWLRKSPKIKKIEFKRYSSSQERSVLSASISNKGRASLHSTAGNFSQYAQICAIKVLRSEITMVNPKEVIHVYVWYVI